MDSRFHGNDGTRRAAFMAMTGFALLFGSAGVFPSSRHLYSSAMRGGVSRSVWRGSCPDKMDSRFHGNDGTRRAAFMAMTGFALLLGSAGVFPSSRHLYSSVTRGLLPLAVLHTYLSHK